MPRYRFLALAALLIPLSLAGVQPALAGHDRHDDRWRAEQHVRHAPATRVHEVRKVQKVQKVRKARGHAARVAPARKVVVHRHHAQPRREVVVVREHHHHHGHVAGPVIGAIVTLKVLDVLGHHR